MFRYIDWICNSKKAWGLERIDIKRICHYKEGKPYQCEAECNGKFPDQEWRDNMRARELAKIIT